MNTVGSHRRGSVIAGAVLAVLLCAPVSASVLPTPPRVQFLHPTVTAPDKHGDVALSVTVRNQSSQSVTLLNIADTPSQGFMFFTAPSIVSGHGAMSYIATVPVRAHRSVVLGFSHLGAMLTSVPAAHLGTMVPLTIRWTTPRGVDFTTVVSFRVVAAPAHLRFVMR